MSNKTAQAVTRNSIAFGKAEELNDGAAPIPLGFPAGICEPCRCIFEEIMRTCEIVRKRRARGGRAGRGVGCIVEVATCQKEVSITNQRRRCGVRS